MVEGKPGNFNTRNVRGNVFWTELPTLSTIKTKQATKTTKRMITMANNQKQTYKNLCIHSKGKREKETHTQSTEKNAV